MHYVEVMCVEPSVCLLLNIYLIYALFDIFLFNHCVKLQLGNSDIPLYCPKNASGKTIHSVTEYTSCNSLFTI